MTLTKGDFGPPFLFRRPGRGVEKKACDVGVQAAAVILPRDFPRQDSGKDRLRPCSGRERPRPADDQCIPAR